MCLLDTVMLDVGCCGAQLRTNDLLLEGCGRGCLLLLAGDDPRANVLG